MIAAVNLTNCSGNSAAVKRITQDYLECIRRGDVELRRRWLQIALLESECALLDSEFSHLTLLIQRNGHQTPTVATATDAFFLSCFRESNRDNVHVDVMMSRSLETVGNAIAQGLQGLSTILDHTVRDRLVASLDAQLEALSRCRRGVLIMSRRCRWRITASNASTHLRHESGALIYTLAESSVLPQQDAVDANIINDFSPLNKFSDAERAAAQAIEAAEHRVAQAETVCLQHKMERLELSRQALAFHIAMSSACQASRQRLRAALGSSTNS